ncbi:MAG: insulinase family protein [Neisseriaceae bacterium]
MQRKLYLFSLSLLLVLNLNGCSNLKEMTSYDQLPRSQIDRTEQKVIQLKNGMKVLLIGDPAATEARVVVNVGVGGYQDPKYHVGLSHFLEHSIFLGSAKYPKPNEFFSFLSAHGGEANARTTDTGTSFYFNVATPFLGEALGRLVDALAHPNLSEAITLSELKNIQAEFKSKRFLSVRQVRDAMAETIYNPKHPLSYQPFGGNIVSLVDQPKGELIKSLRAFHQHYYSANLISAVIYAPLPRERLARLAKSYLGTFPNRRTVLLPLTEKRIEDKAKRTILHLKSADKSRVINLKFQLPKSDSNSVGLTYIAYLLEDRQPGTVYSFLQKKNLITQLSSDYEITRLEPEDEFNVYLFLTNKGMKHQDTIVKGVFDYLRLIQKQGIDRRYYGQLKQIIDNRFNHLKIGYTTEYLAQLSSLMQEVPSNQLYNHYLLPSSMPTEVIHRLLNYLEPRNATIVYASPQENTNRISTYYQSRYQIETFPIERFSNRSALPDVSQYLCLPPLNTYIVTDFSLNTPKNLLRKKPKLLENPEQDLIYAMPSRYFRDNPEAYLQIEITNPMHFTSAKDYALLKLANSIFLKHYSGEFSRYDYSNIAWDYLFTNGQSLFLSGIPQHMLAITRDLLTKAKHFQFNDPQELREAKQEVKGNLIEQESHEGALAKAYALLNAFEYDFVQTSTLGKAVDKVTLNDLQKYHFNLLGKNRTKIYSLGNLNDQQVLNIAAQVKKIFPSTSIQYPPMYFPELHPQKLVYTQQDQGENNAIVVAYYLPESSLLENRVYVRFLARLLNEFFFYKLRTQQQLGYELGVTEAKLSYGRALAFYIQSPTTSPKELYEAVKGFYPEALKFLKSLSREGFERYQTAIWQDFAGVPTSMADEFTEHGIDFATNHMGTPIFQQLAELTKQTTQQKIIDYFTAAVLEEKGLVLLSEIAKKVQNSKALALPEYYRRYHNLDEVHRSLSFSPLRF